MNNHCPDCGSSLVEGRDLTAYWLRILRCPSCESCDLLEVADMRWIFPLLRLEPGVREKIEEADSETMKLATQRIRQIDYKTVSIIDFEHTLLGYFDETRRYRVIYPDGSEK